MVEQAGRNMSMNLRLIVGGMLASMWLQAPPTWAVQYRLQVVNLDALAVFARGKTPSCRGLGRSA
jgi:hypothetical protein